MITPDQDNKSRNLYMLKGAAAEHGYDWWWHSFTGYNVKTGEAKPFFIEYFVINPALGGLEPVYGCEGLNKPSYVMINAGCWGSDARQLHRFFGTSELDVAEDELRFVVGDCFLSEDLLRGNVEVSKEDARIHPEYLSDAGSMSWLLRVNKTFPFNVGYGASKMFRDMNAFEMYWHVQGIRTFYDGTVYLDGEEYRVSPDDCFGYADKNWGRDYTNPWVWLSSCNMFSMNTGKRLTASAFDIGGGRPKVGPIALNSKLLIKLYYEGSEFEFNFSKLNTGSKTLFKCKETSDKILWKIKASNNEACLEVEAYCMKKDMLLIRYENPDGKREHTRLWNGGNAIARLKLYKKLNGQKHLVDHIEAHNCGCEWGKY